MSAPAITVSPATAASSGPPTVLARKVLVQPERIEMQLPVGYTTGTLVFTLFSDVNTEVVVRPLDSRLKFRGAGNNLLRLNAYTLQTANFVVLEAHRGVIELLNTRGEVIEKVRYTVVPHKAVNQSANLSYNPFSGQVSAGYSVSTVPASSLAPNISAGVGMGYDIQKGQLGGSVYLNVRW
ncbi:hypothetical protein [Deinococcus fonticola]|uniref:hypothetical protein n=1 Tax=Deinococcus fonticola TaxID=2528713 RepID=UPI001074D9DA|nr:hypothetical protein [Deinococcus fonticola]